MNKSMSFLSGAGLGALIMYVLDPNQGSNRRKVAGTRARHSLQSTGRSIRNSARDITNRTKGVVAETRSRFSSEEVSDETLVARVRSHLGRLGRNARLIDVSATSGFVTVRGPVFSSDVKHLIRHVAGIKGVKGVENQLDVHEQAGETGGIQVFEFEQSYNGHVKAASRPWISGLAGGALVSYGLIQRGKLGWSLSAAGTGLIFTGLGRSRSSANRQQAHDIIIRKSIMIHAPVEDVYGYWSNIDNFPLFMTNVRNVEDRGEGISHWVVAGPAGKTFEWDARITENVENELIAWESLPGSSIQNAGRVRFVPGEDNSTRVEIQMSYYPPAGALGHSIARLFGSDPKSEMDQDLIRMKNLIETGNPPHDAADPLLKEARENRD